MADLYSALAKPAPLSVVLLLDVLSTIIELLISALFYHNVIIIAQALRKYPLPQRVPPIYLRVLSANMIRS